MLRLPDNTLFPVSADVLLLKQVAISGLSLSSPGEVNRTLEFSHLGIMP